MTNNHGRMRPRSVGSIALTGLLGVLTVVAGTQAQGDSDESAPATARASDPPLVHPVHRPPITAEEMQAAVEAAKQVAPLPLYIPNEGRTRAPTDPTARPDLAMPTSPPMQIPPMFNAAGEGRAPGDFRVFRNHIMNDTETNDSTSTQTGEPSVGMNGRIVWTSGNTYAAVSGDAAQNFTYINPFDNFPADGTADTPAGAFCCDQVVQYDRTRGLMLWYLQYRGTGGCGNCPCGNIGRLAVSRGQRNQANNSWDVYDFPPSFFGYGATVGFDFPDMALGTNNLYITTNICGHGSDRAICIRLNLDDLAAAAPVQPFNTRTSRGNLRCTQGAGTTMFFGTQVDTNTLRIYRWPESSGSATSRDRDVTAWSTGSSAPDPGGVDWIARDFNDILAAYLSGPNIVFMWGSAAGGAYPMPNIRIARFRVSDRTLVDQGAIWSNTVAWAYPAFHPNDRGDVGGTMVYGGGGSYASMIVAIADNYGGSQTGPMDGLTVATGNQSPTGARWGDYFTGRRNVPYGNTWAATGYVVRSEEPGRPTQPHVVWFGREADRPPASNTIYVDRANGTGWEEGTAVHPYDTATEGHFAAVDGDTIRIQAGSYAETVTFTTATTIHSDGGSAILGQ